MNPTYTLNTRCHVIELEGWLNKETSPDWQRKFEDIITEGNNSLVVDCSRLEYVSSAGFCLLLKIAKQVTKNHGRIIFSSMEEHILEVLRISGLEDFFPAQFSS